MLLLLLLLQLLHLQPPGRHAGQPPHQRRLAAQPGLHLPLRQGGQPGAVLLCVFSYAWRGGKGGQPREERS